MQYNFCFSYTFCVESWMLTHIHTSQLRCLLWPEIYYKHMRHSVFRPNWQQLWFLKTLLLSYPATTRLVIYLPAHNGFYLSKRHKAILASFMSFPSAFPAGAMWYIFSFFLMACKLCLFCHNCVNDLSFWFGFPKDGSVIFLFNGTLSMRLKYVLFIILISRIGIDCYKKFI